jgi:ribonuclease P protein component
MIVASSVSQESSGHRLGVTVSRRVGGAVIRNRIKRRIRAWFRQNRGELVASSDLVVIARRPAADLSGLATQAELSKLLRAVGGRGS